jgi:hypothetical protein
MAAVSEGNQPEIERHINRIVALSAEARAMKEAAEASRTVNVGGYHVAQPVPRAAPPPPPLIPIELPESFAGYEQDIAHAQRVATAAGASSDLASLLVMLGNIRPHERRTPSGASEEAKQAAADRAMEALTTQYGAERANAKAAAAMDALQELHLWHHVQARGLEYHPDVLEYFGRFGVNHLTRRA